MKPLKPIKRHPALQPISREHHQGLLLCWKLRTGFNKGIAADRIKRYTDWFFENHIKPHFQLEEAFIFPILDGNHEMVKKALSQHRRLKRLFKDKKEIEKSLSLIEKELEQHIRFEERVLFQEIQKTATQEQLDLITVNHSSEDYQENTRDMFWT